MALHGDIRINGTELWRWSATRHERVPGEVNKYDVALYGPDGRAVAEHVLTHPYADGAIGLAVRVLTWANDARATPIDKE